MGTVLKDFLVDHDDDHWRYEGRVLTFCDGEIQLSRKIWRLGRMIFDRMGLVRGNLRLKKRFLLRENQKG